MPVDVNAKEILVRAARGSALATGTGFLITGLFLALETLAGGQAEFPHSEVVGVVAGFILAPYFALAPVPERGRLAWILVRALALATATAWITFHLVDPSERASAEVAAGFVWSSIFAGTALASLLPSRPPTSPPSSLPPLPPVSGGPTFQPATPSSRRPPG